jgi:hypothetical protein
VGEPEPESLRSPQLTPSDHCYAILQDHGPRSGGWGPAAIALPPLIPTPAPFVYTGSSEGAIEVATAACRQLAQITGKPTRLVRYTHREDLVVFGGSN